MKNKLFLAEDRAELSNRLNALLDATNSYLRALESDDSSVIDAEDCTWRARAQDCNNFADVMFDNYENGEFSIVGEVIAQQAFGEAA